MSRSPRFVILLALVLPAGAPAQEIPLSGRWTLAGELVQGPAWDQDAFEAYVNDCGDEVTVVHPELAESLVLRYVDGSYAGEAEIRARALMKVNLTPTSERHMTGSFRVIAPEAPFPLDWETALDYAGDAEGDPPVASHGADRTIDSEVERQGLYVTRTETRRVEITDFPPGSSDLLPQHRDVLDWTLEKMMEDDSGVSGRQCETVESNWAGPAVGYADRRLERSNHDDLARSRAANLDRYVAPKFKARWEGTLVGGGPGALGIEVGSDGEAPGCPRAATAEYTTIRRYFDMYSDEDAEEWLEDRLTDEEWLADEPGSGERDEDWLEWMQDALSPNAPEHSSRRFQAKGAYCMARGLIDMLEDGHCELARHSAAELALMGERQSRTYAEDGRQKQNWGPYTNPRQETFDAFRGSFLDADASVARTGGSAMSGIDDTAVDAEKERKEAASYRYAFAWSDDCKADADRIERGIFGDVTAWDNDGPGAR